MPPIQKIQQYILLIRGEKVILDTDIASMYGVETRTLVQAVKRHLDRFPKDFMFQLTPTEYKNLRSQSVISSWGGRRSAPYAFTEQGVAMLSSVLHSKKAIKINIEIMRVFVYIRHLIDSNRSLRDKIRKMEAKYDYQFQIIFEAIKQLTLPKELPKKRPIGFAPWDE